MDRISQVATEPETTQRLRKVLLAIIAIVVLGTAAELFLLEHFKSGTQWIAVALLVAAAIVLILVVVAPSKWSLQLFRAVMLVVALGGAYGVKEHLEVNTQVVEATNPETKGMAQFFAAFKGGTPALAPGALAQLGLIGLAFTFRHPKLQDGA